MRRFSLMLIMAAGLTAGPVSAVQSGPPDPLPRPDGKRADMSEPVQVYILMGQSNMLGFGKVDGLADACKNKGLYPYLIDDDGNWTERRDVRFVRVMCSGSGPSKTHNNEWMTIKSKIGPEMGIGHYVGHATEAPVLILKTCIGNRSLGYDLLPPSAEGYAGDPNPSKRPTPGPWYAGVQYDGDIAAAKKVLAQLGKHYPGAKKYQVAGFFWWQGDKDFRNAEHAASYEKNLLCLIESLRKDFKAPDARFVCATLGQTKKGAGGPQGEILKATLNMDGSKGKYRSHKGKVASVYSHPLSMGSSSSAHYGGNAETYMNIGQAMGIAMAKMIKKSPSASLPGIDVSALDSSLKRVHKSIVSGKLNEAEKTIRPYLAGDGHKDTEQFGYAQDLEGHLNDQLNGIVRAMTELSDSGELCQLRDGLAKNDPGCQGIPVYDRKKVGWDAALTAEDAVLEMAIGDKLNVILARKDKAKFATYFGQVQGFLDAYPTSFYATRAEAEIRDARAILQKALDEIAMLGEVGDMYSKYEMIKESKSRFAKINEFDEASEGWASEAKDPEVRKCVAAGKAYAEVFEDLASQKELFKKSQARDSKITGGSKRAKAAERTTESHLKKLKALAARLEKLASKNAGNYYGRAASKSYLAYTDSEGQTLTDEREK